MEHKIESGIYDCTTLNVLFMGNELISRGLYISGGIDPET